MLRIYIIKHIMMSLNKKTQNFRHHDSKLSSQKALLAFLFNLFAIL